MRTLLTLLPALALLAPVVLAAEPVVPVNPVLNGDFVTYVADPGSPEEVSAPTGHTVRLAGYTKGAVGWNSDGRSSEEYGDFDGDGDVEVRVANDPAASTHNFWQNSVAATNAFTLDFAAYTFRLESGTVPSAASVMVQFNLAGTYDVHPFVPFVEGYLRFRPSQATPAADGTVTMEPSGGAIRCHGEFSPELHGACEAWLADLKDAEAAGDAAGVKALLQQARIVQHDFWAFNRGSAPVVIDDVAITGAHSVVDAAASGNVLSGAGGAASDALGLVPAA